MTTARDIVKGMLRKISALGSGAQLGASDADDALVVLNQMLSSWSAEGNLVFSETVETFPLVGGTVSYTVGSGGDFNTVRPVDIVRAYVSQGTIDYSLYKLDRVNYADLVQKTIGAIPDSFYYDAGFPLGTIKLYPVPRSVNSITLYSNKPLAGFAGLDTVYNMPFEYESALIYNGAVWIAPEYEREASPTVKKIASATKKVIEVSNSRNDKYASSVNLAADKGDNDFGGYNINSGYST